MSSPSGSAAVPPKKLASSLSSLNLSEGQHPVQATTTDAHVAVLRAEPHEVRATAAVSSSFGPPLDPATPPSLSPATSSSLGRATSTSSNPNPTSSLSPGSATPPQDVAALLKLLEEARKAKEEAEKNAAEERKAKLEAEQKAAEDRKAKEEAEQKAADDRKAKEEAEQKAAESDRKAAESDRKAAESDRKAAEVEKKAAKQVYEAQMGTSLLGGFPKPLVSSQFADSTPAASVGKSDFNQNLEVQTADPVTKLQHLMCPLRDLPERQRVKGVTWSTHENQRSAITAEHNIQSIVTASLTEVCGIYQLPLVPRDSLAHKCGIPDISVISSVHFSPFVVAEVKKFGGRLDSKSAHQQMSRYLTGQRLDYGIPAPIGILTSYNFWQFCWHQYANPVARAETTADVENFSHVISEGDFDTLCVSPVYSCNDPVLRVLIASVMAKMACFSPIPPVSRYWAWYTKERTYSRHSAGLEPDDVDTTMMTKFSSESKNSEGLYRCRPLGTGAEGVTYLMADENGWSCAAKFFKWAPETARITEEEYNAVCSKMCNKEYKAWTRAYDYEVREVKLATRHALLMPVFENISVADWEESGTMDIVMKHIEELFDKDARHKDINVRHVMWGDSIKQSVVLIDWGAATNIEWGSKMVKDFSKEEYLDYAKAKLDAGIEALKEKALSDAKTREADEALVAAKVKDAQEAVRAAETYAAEAKEVAEAKEAEARKTKEAANDLAKKAELAAREAQATRSTVVTRSMKGAQLQPPRAEMTTEAAAAVRAAAVRASKDAEAAEAEADDAANAAKVAGEEVARADMAVKMAKTALAAIEHACQTRQAARDEKAEADKKVRGALIQARQAWKSASRKKAMLDQAKSDEKDARAAGKGAAEIAIRENEVQKAERASEKAAQKAAASAQDMIALTKAAAKAERQAEAVGVLLRPLMKFGSAPANDDGFEPDKFSPLIPENPGNPGKLASIEEHPDEAEA